ncbi:MAG: DUF1360 domain-containing protein [Anaerolineaceae bacterium]|nr:DUF1360 domain-containing protein [Anaerolineaceae bacterium]
MSSNVNQSKRWENITKLGLIAIFLGGLALFIGYMTFWGPGLSAFKVGWIDLILLTFATYRLGHLISYDRVMEPFRHLFTDTLPDSTGAGETVEPKGTGFQQAIGQLVCCPICSGTWIAALLVYGLYLWPDSMHVFLTMTAAIGGAEILNSASEALSWTGQHQRTLSGAHMSARKKNIVRIEQPCEEHLPERDEVESLSERITRVRKKE